MEACDNHNNGFRYGDDQIAWQDQRSEYRSLFLCLQSSPFSENQHVICEHIRHAKDKSNLILMLAKGKNLRAAPKHVLFYIVHTHHRDQSIVFRQRRHSSFPIMCDYDALMDNRGGIMLVVTED